MLIHTRLFCIALATICLISFSGCAGIANQTVDPPASETPEATEAPVSEEPESDDDEQLPDEEADDSPAPAEGEPGLVTDLIGNINYTYRDDLTVVDIEGTQYVYYTDTSFFFVDTYTAPLMGMETLDESDAEEYFVAAEQSFNEGDWSNGQMVTDIEKVNFNGLDVWINEMEMEHVSGTDFTCVAAVLFYDGALTSFTLITDNGAYQAAVSEFADTLMSISAA